MTTCPILALFPLLVVLGMFSSLLLCIGLLLLSLACVFVTWLLLLLLGLIDLLLFVSSQLLLSTFCCTLVMAQWGYLHFHSAVPKWFISPWSSSGSVKTTSGLWVNVPMTLYLAERLWWLSHCKYWSVWVGLWYTLKGQWIVCYGCDKGVKEGNSPIALSSFHSELDCWIDTVYMIQEYLSVSLFLDDPCVIHKPVPNPGGGVNSRHKCFSLKTFIIQIGNKGTNWWSHCHTINLLIKLVLKRKVSIMQTEPQQFYDVFELIILFCHLTFHPFPIDP